jgi:hypothetical protein
MTASASMPAAPSARTHVAQEVCLAVLDALKARDQSLFQPAERRLWICRFP